jgi:hypothetical protein
MNAENLNKKYLVIKYVGLGIFALALVLAAVGIIQPASPNGKLGIF